MPPDVADALDALKASGYADSMTGCIYLAIVEAWQRVNRLNEKIGHPLPPE